MYPYVAFFSALHQCCHGTASTRLGGDGRGLHGTGDSTSAVVLHTLHSGECPVQPLVQRMRRLHRVYGVGLLPKPQGWCPGPYLRPRRPAARSRFARALFGNPRLILRVRLLKSAPAPKVASTPVTGGVIQSRTTRPAPHATHGSAHGSSRVEIPRNSSHCRLHPSHLYSYVGIKKPPQYVFSIRGG